MKNILLLSVLAAVSCGNYASATMEQTPSKTSKLPPKYIISQKYVGGAQQSDAFDKSEEEDTGTITRIIPNKPAANPQDSKPRVKFIIPATDEDPFSRDSLSDDSLDYGSDDDLSSEPQMFDYPTGDDLEYLTATFSLPLFNRPINDGSFYSDSLDSGSDDDLNEPQMFNRPINDGSLSGDSLDYGSDDDLSTTRTFRRPINDDPFSSYSLDYGSDDDLNEPRTFNRPINDGSFYSDSLDSGSDDDLNEPRVFNRPINDGSLSDDLLDYGSDDDLNEPRTFNRPINDGSFYSDSLDSGSDDDLNEPRMFDRPTDDDLEYLTTTQIFGRPINEDLSEPQIFSQNEENTGKKRGFRRVSVAEVLKMNPISNETVIIVSNEKSDTGYPPPPPLRVADKKEDTAKSEYSENLSEDLPDPYAEKGSESMESYNPPANQDLSETGSEEEKYLDSSDKRTLPEIPKISPRRATGSYRGFHNYDRKSMRF